MDLECLGGQDKWAWPPVVFTWVEPRVTSDRPGQGCDVLA